MSQQTSTVVISPEKHAVLFLQEVVCWQRPVLSVIWVASLHTAWFILTSDRLNLLSACYLLCSAVVVADYCYVTLHKSAKQLQQQQSELQQQQSEQQQQQQQQQQPASKSLFLQALLPATIQREQGEYVPSTLAFMDPPRTYAELTTAWAHMHDKAAEYRGLLLSLRTQHDVSVCATAAVSFLVLGAFANRFSGKALSYLWVLHLILFPVLERISFVRHTVAAIKPTQFIAQIKHAIRSAEPYRPQEEDVIHLSAALPTFDPTAPLPENPEDIEFDEHEALMKQKLTTHLNDELELEQRQEALKRDTESIRRSRRIASGTLSSASLNSADTSSNASASSSAEAHSSQEGLRQRGSQLMTEDEEGFAIVNRSEIEEC